MVLGGGSELPREITLTHGSGHRIRIHVRLMSEYNRFRRADLQEHLPLALGARLLKNTTQVTLEVDSRQTPDGVGHSNARQPSASDLDSGEERGFINGSGRGVLDLVLHRADTCKHDTVAIEMEIFVHGAASAQVLPVLTPVIHVNTPSSHPGAQTDSSRPGSQDAAAHDGRTQLDGTRAGTRHVLRVPSAAEDQLSIPSVYPPGLYITELTGAHVSWT